MPPHATHIDQEGLRLCQVLIAQADAFVPPALPGCRQPEEVLADLEAQVAACAAGAHGLHALRSDVGTEVFLAQLDHLQDQGERLVQALLSQMGGTYEAREVLDDGTPIDVKLDVFGHTARLQITAPAHPGNLNAPQAVARAAVLYVLRSLVQDGLPILNEGALRPIEISIPPGSLFDPAPPAAVAGGNVETSQRLVDALLQAIGAQAASQGTMNNLTVGTPAGTFYETIAGGAGAGPDFDGPSALQVHMTNTRATDIEVLESRFPVQIRRWSVRQNSGGPGHHSGGDGVIKEWEFLAPAQVAMLAERRKQGAPGLKGGHSGAPGQTLRWRDHQWNPAPAQWCAETGEVLRVCTPGGGGWGRPTEGPKK
jgi:5-oxoprolinase (ATP-hydrolysing)